LYNKNKQGAKMCICINCFYLKNCSVYKFIEEQHEISLNPSSKKSFFTPKQTIIKNEIASIDSTLIVNDWDVSECSNFFEKPGIWLKKS